MIRWNRAEEQRLFRDPRGPVANDMRRRGRNAVRAAQARAPVRSGLLRSSIGTQMNVDAEGLYMDLVATAASPRGFIYAVVQEVRHPFMYPSVNAMRR